MAAFEHRKLLRTREAFMRPQALPESLRRNPKILVKQFESPSKQSGPTLRPFAQHVVVEVALGVAVLHRDLRQHVDHLGQQGWRGDVEALPSNVRRAQYSLR